VAIIKNPNESINAKFQRKLEQKKLNGKCSMSEFVDVFDELIQEQNDKMKYALFGLGDIIIKPEYKNIFVDPINFSKLTSNQKEKYFIEKYQKEKKLDTFNPTTYKESLVTDNIDLEIPGKNILIYLIISLKNYNF
jgi:hypothetical protein